MRTDWVEQEGRKAGNALPAPEPRSSGYQRSLCVTLKKPKVLLCATTERGRGVLRQAQRRFKTNDQTKLQKIPAALGRIYNKEGDTGRSSVSSAAHGRNAARPRARPRLQAVPPAGRSSPGAGRRSPTLVAGHSLELISLRMVS